MTETRVELSSLLQKVLVQCLEHDDPCTGPAPWNVALVNISVINEVSHSAVFGCACQLEGLL